MKPQVFSLARAGQVTQADFVASFLYQFMEMETMPDPEFKPQKLIFHLGKVNETQ